MNKLIITLFWILRLFIKFGGDFPPNLVSQKLYASAFPTQFPPFLLATV